MDALGPLWIRIPFLSLIFVRVIALLFSMPLFEAQSIPTPAKVGLALALAWALLPLIPLPSQGVPSDLFQWGGAVLREALVGLSMGWLVQLCLAAVPLAGQVVGFQMGFAIANVVDPLEQQQMSVTAQFLNLMGLWLFLALNGHHLVLTAVFDSFRWFPPGSPGFMGHLGELGLEAGKHLFGSAIMLAAPMLLVLIFVQVALGIVARTVPQMNVFFVALPLQIGVGLVALGTALAFFTPRLTRSLEWLDGVFFFLGKAG